MALAQRLDQSADGSVRGLRRALNGALRVIHEHGLYVVPLLAESPRLRLAVPVLRRHVRLRHR